MNIEIVEQTMVQDLSCLVECNITKDDDTIVNYRFVIGSSRLDGVEDVEAEIAIAIEEYCLDFIS